MTATRYKVHDTLYPHFFTCTVVEWLPVFARPEAAEIVLQSLEFLQSTGRMILYGYVVMENHLHFIASSDTLAKQVKEFKSFTARRILDFLMARNDRRLLDRLKWLKAANKTHSQHQLWQEGSHPQQIDGDALMEQKLNYIHNNPVKRGYVDVPWHWRYSSARNYEGMPGLIPVATDWR